MVYNCNKCNNTFKSEYLLEKHINRKISCDVIFKCEKCRGIFKNNYSLTKHKRRINPCISESELRMQIEFKKLQIKEKMLEYKEKEHQNAKENIILKEKSLDDKKEERKHKKELFISKEQQDLKKQYHEMYMAAYNKLTDLEKITLAEKMKTLRKEKTVSHINNIHIENNIQTTINNNIKLEQNFIQNVIQTYGENPTIIPIEDASKKLISDVWDNPQLTVEIFKTYQTINELLTTFFNKMYKNPANKPIAYYKQLETYYGVSANDGKADLIKCELEDIAYNIRQNIAHILEQFNGAAPMAHVKTKKPWDDFEKRNKEIDDVRKEISEFDIHPVTSKVFSF
ncbi:MAG: C2H2-type zinc finger protein [Cetobacterium sp.]